MPCRATDVTITVGFAAPVISVNYQGGATVSGSSMVTFFAETLESNPTEFAVVLDTTGVATDSKVVTYVSYSDNEGSFPDMSGLMTVASVAPECNPYTASEARRKLQTGGEYDECDVCSNLSSAQLEALDMYDNGGKKIVCDPTCLDGVSDPTHCNCKCLPLAYEVMFDVVQRPWCAWSSILCTVQSTAPFVVDTTCGGENMLP